jgi:hypothetical protein
MKLFGKTFIEEFQESKYENNKICSFFWPKKKVFVQNRLIKCTPGLKAFSEKISSL